MSDLKELLDREARRVDEAPDALGSVLRRRDRKRRNQRIAAGVVGIAAFVGAVWIVTSGGPSERTQTPAGDPTVTPQSAEEVARGFLGAYGASNANQAITYLAEDGDISGLVNSLGSEAAAGTFDQFRLLISFLEASRYQQVLDRCETQTSSPSGTDLRCTFTFQLLGSDQLGRDSFTGSYFDLTVRDGEIVRAEQHWEVGEFSPRMWEPFAEWVSSNHPEDAAVMYEDETYSSVRLTAESVRLWQQRVRQYVQEIIDTYGTAPESSSTGRITRTVDGVPFSFSVPSGGWELFGTISVNKSIVGPQGAEAMIFWTSFPKGGNADLCAGLVDSSIDSNAVDLAAALATAPGTELIAGPSDVTIGGVPAKHVVLAVREDAGCDPGYFYTWQDVTWGALWPETTEGDTIRVWIIELEGTVLFIEAETTSEADTGLKREIDQIIESIRFE